MKATYRKYILTFKNPSGTSRGVLTTKETYFIKIEYEGKIGYGETGLFRGLSFDDVVDYEEKLQWACNHVHLGLEVLLVELSNYPSIQFGLEQAFLSMQGVHSFELIPSDFTRKEAVIPINGLVWMGDYTFMETQIKAKLTQGFTTIKLKIGAIDFESELKLLKNIRKQFDEKTIEIRVDANGAFKFEEAIEKLKRLSDYNLHSIEQPIKQGHVIQMAELCSTTPIPIALDEELIGVVNIQEKQHLITAIQPQYIILKPSLVGGFKGTHEWISIANQFQIPYWITSALESNIGLNAISQFTYPLTSKMPQGLGTGGLFINNIAAPLVVEQGSIVYQQNKVWDYKFIEKIFS